jgi:hypothetical protein
MGPTDIGTGREHVNGRVPNTMYQQNWGKYATGQSLGLPRSPGREP